MPDSPKPAASPLDRYLAHRRFWEAALWLAFFLVQVVFNSVVATMDARRGGYSFDYWEPLVWESSSAILLIALMPAMLAFDRRVPLQWASWRRGLALHAIASLVYSLVHVLGMVALRDLAYLAMGSHYRGFSHPLREFFYEYLKDVRTYASLLALVYLYRLLLLRLQGEARLLAEPDEGPPVESVERPERFLVRKLGKEFLVAARDIEWLEAAENYVNLHVRGHSYPLRSTMAAIEQKLDPDRFLRVHRRYIVNLDQLRHIEPLESGDARLLLQDGTHVPCSRRYRAALKRAA